ncbi:hypothetical protein N5J43_08175 [Pseudomonas nicosulfuronedens]|uniref:hypothetical protein n=1 Tax=Pseudomonas nicosulfuronedens TaxID=2571105 RepID=UPI00244687C1|nr:hypothetical protein [Pseudomonas nicosulfuronedens]MDH1009949.1 hypothetical protein [Pseudomonas nicosulfuronedens]MDH1978925.1 hypothetical protein [Pseudomonas nicosulfuronedens]MDH2028396.1 hypothetical protein [Pseudomonas nicosulfuronedens]
MSSPPLISCQRFLDRRRVLYKATNFKVFIVRTLDLELRGRRYRLLLDGHHNLAAAKLAGTEPTWRGPPPKFQRIQRRLPPAEFARQMINNLTDSDWYYVDTGEVVDELLAVEKTP